MLGNSPQFPLDQSDGSSSNVKLTGHLGDIQLFFLLDKRELHMEKSEAV